jgi:DcmR-like sensory protein
MHSSHRSYADLDWLRPGDHVCQFYRTAEDLTEVLVPFFMAGLERNESCLWIAGDSCGAEKAVGEMRAAVADFDRRVAAGQMQIVSHEEWYRQYGTMSADEAAQGLLAWKDRALGSGYTGVRSGGNPSSLYKTSLDAFLTYERVADKAFKGQPIVALCNYCLARYSGKTALEVMQSHGFGLAKRRDQWRAIEVWRRNQRSTRVAHAPSSSMPNQEANVAEVVEELLAVYMLAYPGRITLDGAHIALPASPALKLRMALHELVANAAEFGALAMPQGALAVKWHVAVNGSPRLYVTWAEHGLSGLTIPEKVGRGTLVVAGAVENCVRVFEPTSLRCTFELSF